MRPEDTEPTDYRAAGVDVEAGRQLVRSIRNTVADTQGPEVLGGLTGFAGLYALGTYRDPVLVSGTDGVGTKLELARAAGRLDTIGQDLVAMCINDILCHGARPLFFLDYIAVDSVRSVDPATIVTGVAAACREAGCALIGGETAEMPGIYRPGRFDLAGFAVGVVERDAIVDGSAVREGMTVVGLQSSGFHSNGFSLLRRLFPATEDRSAADQETVTMRDTLLTPTRIYRAALEEILAAAPVAGIAHVTGGGWWENLPRLLGEQHDGVRIVVEAGAVTRPPAFALLEHSAVSPAEAYRTFNMGLGMAVAVPAAAAATVIEAAGRHGVPAWEIGSIERRRPGDPDLEIRGVPDSGRQSE